MPVLDEVELVVTNNLARTQRAARMNSTNYNHLNEEIEIQDVVEQPPSSSSRSRAAEEDDHLLSPGRKARRNCCSSFWSWCCGPKQYTSRTVWIGRENFQKFPANVIRNQKYNIITLIPIVSFEYRVGETKIKKFVFFYRFCSISSSFSSTSSSYSWPSLNSSRP